MTENYEIGKDVQRIEMRLQFIEQRLELIEKMLSADNEPVKK